MDNLSESGSVFLTGVLSGLVENLKLDILFNCERGGTVEFLGGFFHFCFFKQIKGVLRGYFLFFFFWLL